MEKGVIFIDLILCKNEAYRHIIFNRFSTYRRVKFLNYCSLSFFQKKEKNHGAFECLYFS